MSDAVLTYDDVTVAYGGSPVLAGVSLAVAPGEVLAIVGESGCGKTTLLRAATGLLGPAGTVASGDVRFRGASLPALSPEGLRAVRGAGIGMVFQDAAASFAPVRTVGDQLTEALRAHVRVSRAEARARGLGLFERLGLEDPPRIWASYPFELSGGMAQRVGIAAAALLEPAVLLADEPTSALDPASRAAVLELIGGQRDAGRAVILVAHDLDAVRTVADRIAVMRGGRIVEEGPAARLLANPADPYTRLLLDDGAIDDEATGENGVDGADGATPAGSGAVEAATPATAPAANLAPVLAARDLAKTYRASGRPDVRALAHASLALAPGEAVGVVGPSGSGKSTLARLLASLEEPDAGAIELAGEDVAHLRGRALRRIRGRVQLVFQNPAGSFDPRRTVGDGVGEALRNRGASRAQAAVRAGELLGRCGLAADLAGRYPHELSGGQLQRAALARALATDPAVLICDEATSALDAVSRRQVMALLADLRRERGLAIFLITHDHALARRFCDRIFQMRAGRLG